MKKHSLFLFLLPLLVLLNACQKELSYETNGTPSAGLLQSDLSGDCLPKTVNGVYEATTALNGATSYIDVQVDVLVAGSYLIYTDTVNGIYFRTNGIFTITGLNTVRLKGFGTPVAAGISNFVVTYGITSCTVPVTILPAGGASPAAFTLSTGTAGECISAAVSGTYTQGVLLDASNKVVINVNATTIGTYNVSTVATNGMTFSGTGAFIATGPNTITLTASGTPGTSGTTNIPVTVGTSTCSFPVTVIGPATYTINCGSAVVAGTYAQGVALTAGNTVSIQVNVATAGGYNITGTISGMTFSKSGAFTTTGPQTITLAGSGMPTASGTLNVPMAGSTPCTFPVTVSGPATYTVNCGSATVNGDYEEGVALDATNTVDISVNVATIGSYTITGAINGMTFSKSGVFTTTGVQTITLAGSGTPAADGTFNVPMPGMTPCTFAVTVDPGTAPGTIDWKFTEGATTYQGITTDATVEVMSMPPFGTVSMLSYEGETSGGDVLSFSLVDVAGGIQNNETYSSSGAGTNAVLMFDYDGGPGYTAGVGETGVTLSVKVTAHNTAAKTIEGTFSGTVKDGSGATKTISGGTFKGTYP